MSRSALTLLFCVIAAYQPRYAKKKSSLCSLHFFFGAWIEVFFSMKVLIRELVFWAHLPYLCR